MISVIITAVPVWVYIEVFIPFICLFTCRISVVRRTFSIESVKGEVCVILCFIAQWIYIVVTIEQTIQQNPVIRNGLRFPITFGQVCAFPVDYHVY